MQVESRACPLISAHDSIPPRSRSGSVRCLAVSGLSACLYGAMPTRMWAWSTPYRPWLLVAVYPLWTAYNQVPPGLLAPLSRQ
ncbi:hypothetical protein BDW75DRAFT_200983 [Aspergillus navahoensis]